MESSNSPIIGRGGTYLNYLLELQSQAISAMLRFMRWAQVTSDHGAHGGATSWAVDFAGDIPIWLAVALVAFWYWRAAHRVTKMHPSQRWPVRYGWCFGAGLSCLVVVTTGPIANAAMSIFAIHMAQHIILMMWATPLLVMGAPVLLALRALAPDSRRRWLVPLLRSSFFRFLTNPIVSWLVFAAVLMGVHFAPVMSSLMEAGLLGRYAEYALYLVAAFLYYYALLPGNPATNRVSPAARVFSLFLMMVPETMTGFFIYSANFTLFPYFEASAAAAGFDGIADQQLGGALMWSTSMIIDVAWIAVAVHEWFGSEGLKTRRLDIQIQREEAIRERETP